MRPGSGEIWSTEELRKYQQDYPKHDAVIPENNKRVRLHVTQKPFDCGKRRYSRGEETDRDVVPFNRGVCLMRRINLQQSGRKESWDAEEKGEFGRKRAIYA